MLVAHRRPPWASTIERQIGQTQTQAVRFGRHERLEYAFEIRRGYSRASVGDGDFNAAVRGRLCSHQQPAVRFLAVHGVASVDHEIEHHLLQLVPIAAHGWQRLGEVGADHYVTVQQVAAHQTQRFLDHVVEVERMTLRLFLPEHGSKPLNHCSGAVIALHDIGEDFRELVDARRTLREKPLRRLRIAQDGRQRLVELVRERSGQLAQHRDP